ncbi:alpha-methylacyl-CoA racemase-like [Styela clava]
MSSEIRMTASKRLLLSANSKAIQFIEMALKGISVLELSGLAPVPFAGMVLADFGAKVTRVDRTKGHRDDRMGRGKRSIAVDLKKPEGIEVVKRLSTKSDVIIEPFRPGVMEKLGLGPNILMKSNPRLIYARISGFGQSGPWKMMAGHDINYIATSGILSYLCRDGERPHPPINLVADFAGGGLTCAFGIVAALLEREKSGLGQVVDVSMTEGSAYVSTFAYVMKSMMFFNKPGNNLLDTGAPFYDCYTTKDGRHVAIGALEPQFYEKLIEGLGLDSDDLPSQLDIEKWPELRKSISEKVSSYTMEELNKIFEGSDACLTPVLTPEEAAQHPHNRANGSFFKTDDGQDLPTPAPRLSRTPAQADTNPGSDAGQHTREVLSEYGFTKEEIETLERKNVVNERSNKL